MRNVTLLLLLVSASWTHALVGQEAVVGSVSGIAEVPEWMTRWTPTAQVAELPWGIPGWSLNSESSLLFPQPKAGPFWAGGNPAGLRSRDNGRWSSTAVGRRSAAGDYRKPLDPKESQSLWINGMGWRPVGTTASAIGRISVESTRHEQPTLGSALIPYAIDPHVVMDTSGTATGDLSVRLDGAMAWDVGPGVVGLALGYRASQRRTAAAAVAKTHRTAMPGVTLGAALPLQGGRWWVGLHGLWQRTTEAVEMTGISGWTDVYLLNGFGDPNAIRVDGLFRRRLERDVGGGVLTVSGTVRSAVLDLAVGVYRVEDEHWPIGQDADPPLDRWWADGVSVRLLAQSVDGDGVWWRAGVKRRRVNGSATREAVFGTTFTADESALDLMGEVRGRMGQAWTVTLQAQALREDRHRSDLKVDAAVDLTAWTGSLRGELARALSGRIHLGAGVMAGTYRPQGTIPSASELGPVFRSYVAPGLALSGSAARILGWSLTARFDTRNDAHFWARVRRADVRASGDPLHYAPEGSRRGWFVEAGVGKGIN